MIELLAEGNALASEPRAASFAALPGRFVHDIQTSYDRCNLLTIGVDAMSSFATYSARLPYWVLAGALLGAVTGVLFGDHCALFRPIGTAYVNLMEVVVFPYIICSLLHGLGRLSPDTAWLLFRRSWPFLVLVWAITFLVIFLMSLSIPPPDGPSIVDMTAARGGPDLITLLIPANPFFDLTKNHVPAIVVFSILYGIAIQQLEKKETFLQAVRQRCCIVAGRLVPSRRLDRHFARKKPEISRLEVHDIFKAHPPLRQPQSHSRRSFIRAEECVIVEDPEHLQELHN